MATVRLTDVIVPEVFNRYMMNKTMVNTRLKESGVLRSDPRMQKFLAGGGRTINLPSWNDLDNTSANISSDDPDSSAVPLKTGTFKDIAIRHNRNQHWQDADLTAELAGEDPMKAIGDRVAAYWDREFQRCLISTLKGAFNDNITNDSGDMVYDIATDSAGAITDAERISADAVVDTLQTMGDAAVQTGDGMDSLSLLIMHSVPYRKLQKLNLIDYIPDSSGKIMFPTFLGKDLIISDQCPAVAGSNRTTYWTFLLGRGAICFDQHAPAKPVATDRNELAGDGAGVETLSTRRQFVMHPHGIKFTDTTVTGQSPTDTELELEGNWDRVYPERKQVKMALLQTNG